MEFFGGLISSPGALLCPRQTRQASLGDPKVGILDVLWETEIQECINGLLARICLFYCYLHSKSFDVVRFTLKYTICQENKEARKKIYSINNYINLKIKTVPDF